MYLAAAAVRLLKNNHIASQQDDAQKPNTLLSALSMHDARACITVAAAPSARQLAMSLSSSLANNTCIQSHCQSPCNVGPGSHPYSVTEEIVREINAADVTSKKELPLNTKGTICKTHYLKVRGFQRKKSKLCSNPDHPLGKPPKNLRKTTDDEKRAWVLDETEDAKTCSGCRRKFQRANNEKGGPMLGEKRKKEESEAPAKKKISKLSQPFTKWRASTYYWKFI